MLDRAKGIHMAHYQWPAEKIKESLGENGIMLVALDGQKVVGTAAIAEKNGKAWYATGRYAYMCFAGVLPEYCGQGIYKALIEKREQLAKSKDYKVLVLDTHSDNLTIQKTAINNGYKFVRFFRASSKDHYSVVMAKWLSDCPYSNLYCKWKFIVSKLKSLLLTEVLHR